MIYHGISVYNNPRKTHSTVVKCNKIGSSSNQLPILNLLFNKTGQFTTHYRYKYISDYVILVKYMLLQRIMLSSKHALPL